MIRYSSSVHKSDWECSSKSVRGLFFVNPLYIKNLTNLTNLTILQTLQPYRFLCRVPKGPHAYLCALHKGGPPAPCSVHNLCSLPENRGAPAAPRALHSGLASLRSGEAAIWRASRTRARMGKDLAWRGPRRASHAHAWVQFFISASRVPVKLGNSILEAKFPLACTVRGQSEMMAWNRVNRQK